MYYTVYKCIACECIISTVVITVSFSKPSYFVGKASRPEPIKLVLSDSYPLTFTMQVTDREATAISELYH